MRPPEDGWVPIAGPTVPGPGAVRRQRLPTCAPWKMDRGRDAIAANPCYADPCRRNQHGCDTRYDPPPARPREARFHRPGAVRALRRPHVELRRDAKLVSDRAERPD